MMDDEKFFAWLDGELDPEAAADMQAKVAADPQLSRLAEHHRAFGAQLKGAFDPIADAPIPQPLGAALRPSAQVIDFAAAKQARSMPALAQLAAMAATLAIGIFVGMRVPESSGPVEVHGGKLYAAAALNNALDTQ